MQPKVLVLVAAALHSVNVFAAPVASGMLCALIVRSLL